MSENDVTTREKRPKSLKVLCILTFISTGLSLVVGLMSLASGPMSSKEIKKEISKAKNDVRVMKRSGAHYLAEYGEYNIRLTKDTNKNHFKVVSISMVLALIGLYAALTMWRGAKLGFHIYIIYNILGISSMYLYTSIANIHSLNIIVGVMVSLVFILLYSKNLKWMR